MIHDHESLGSILLVGRSGTGKTSIAVGRMFADYEAFHVSKLWQANDAPPVYRQAFVTANTVLRAQVLSLPSTCLSTTLHSCPLFLTGGYEPESGSVSVLVQTTHLHFSQLAC